MEDRQAGMSTQPEGFKDLADQADALAKAVQDDEAASSELMFSAMNQRLLLKILKQLKKMEDSEVVGARIGPLHDVVSQPNGMRHCRRCGSTWGPAIPVTEWGTCRGVAPSSASEPPEGEGERSRGIEITDGDVTFCFMSKDALDAMERDHRALEKLWAYGGYRWTWDGSQLEGWVAEELGPSGVHASFKCPANAILGERTGPDERRADPADAIQGDEDD